MVAANQYVKADSYQIIWKSRMYPVDPTIPA
jgi:hypothetical protein